jgi:hypothetical protein
MNSEEIRVDAKEIGNLHFTRKKLVVGGRGGGYFRTNYLLPIDHRGPKIKRAVM